ncbi:carbon-nitrogen hydrolase family protein [Streptomyces sp. NPDC088170]|uniref:carbon-nitrogen hydrolase family protein n=1 Tax=Streptomyces sp. NPDC088170 TaxID=3365834 RepID=UPI0038131BD8
MSSPATRRRTVAAVHAAPVFMDTGATVDKAVALIERAGREGIDLLVFPEAFVPGYPYWVEAYAPLDQQAVNAAYAGASVEVPGPQIARIQSACRRAGTGAVLGVSERLVGTRTCFNSQVFIDPDGALLGVHRKLQPTYAERIVWAQGGGATLRVFDSALGRIGGLACWEHTMNLARQSLIAQGQEIHAAAWPGLSTMAGFQNVADVQIDAMMKTHALTAQAFVVCAGNPVDRTCLAWMASALGPQEHITAGGGWSAVIHPFTRYLAGPYTGPEERLVTAAIDLDDLDTVKVWVDSRGHYARPEILGLRVDHRPLWHDEGDRRWPVSPGDTRPAGADGRPLPDEAWHPEPDHS